MMLIELTTGMLTLYAMFSPVSAPTSAQSTVALSDATPIIVSSAFVDILDKKELEAYVREYFKDTPILAEVAYCESTFRHETLDGGVLRGIVNQKDVGLMQINEYYHAGTAKRLGIDLHSLDGNLAYAKRLYDIYGVKPWKSSSACWKKSQAYRDLQNEQNKEIAKI